MNQAPPSIEASSRQAALRTLDRLARRAATQYLRFYREHVPPLRLDDVVGLVIGSMVNWWLGVHQRGCRLDEATLRRCSLLAARYSLGANASFAVAAGVLPRIVWNQGYSEGHVRRWFDSWMSAHLAIVTGAGNHDAELDSRERLLQHFGREALAIALPQSRLRARMRTAVKRWNEEWGQRPSPGEEEPPSLAAILMLAVDGSEGLLPLLRVELSGAIGISDLAVRDGLGTRGRGKPRALSWGDDAERPSQKDNPIQLVMRADGDRQLRAARQAIRAVATARASRRRRGSARRVVLDNIDALLADQIGVVELARRSGLSKAAISDAWRIEREAIAKAPSVKRALKGL